MVEGATEELARLEVANSGHTIGNARWEAGNVVNVLRYYSAAPERLFGRQIPVAGGLDVTFKEPLGVVSIIVPWNFPMPIAGWGFGPALAAGNTVVLKPAELTPLTALRLGELALEAGIPEGVFTVLAGRGSVVGERFVTHPDVRKVCFTGSTAVGQGIMRKAADSLKRITLELGGKSANIVFADADLDQAVNGAIITKFRNTGQSCIAANRIYVQRPVYRQFVDKLVEKAAALKVGPGLEDGVEIGPLIDQRALDQALEHVRQAVAAGAKVLCGGKKWEGAPRGFFLEPTILADVPATAFCMREETFAPVAPICVFDEEAEAIREANNSRYGLAAYAFTHDISRMWRLAEGLEAGTIGINDSVPATSQCPFGGLKASGWGRELGVEGLDAYLETKHISLGVQE